MRYRPRGTQVLLDERGRDAEGRRDIREPVDLDVARQVLRRIDLDTEQRLRIGVLGPIEPLSCNVTDGRLLRARRYRATVRSTQSRHRCRLGRAAGCRGGMSRPRSFPDDRLEELRVLRHRRRGAQLIEAKVAGEVVGVVALGAVAIDDLPLLLPRRVLR